ncbi:hypothetical protein K504DRAFT_383490 [Pleomassaria siparia CBS 279.74]|uniref:Uncharacterized protein n=1 Tax=Pleomassaria siparia CBS 279.74 TaxID=1314801 RepID=A0A6G1K4U3_9PLEO|nr:hypothetical protein K504DRAFT_383490 [Pleomassaria siparia CBS 279.74]
MISQLTQYKHRCECHERETKDIKNQMRQMESLYALTRGIPEKMLKEFRNKTRQITDLKKQLHGEIDLVPYFSTQQAHVGVLITQRLLTGFKDMKDQLASIVVANGTSKLLVDSLYGQSADLDVLLRTVFDVGIRSNMEQTSNASPDLTLHELIQALTGAAIHCWVFESMYRPTAMTNTPLLQKYRDHLVDLWAPEDLYSLDTAVHYSMIEEKDFENVTIPSMASRHTIRLSNALQPLFKKQLQSRMTKKLQSRMTKKLRHTLDDILRLALKIRSLSLVGTEEYESIWPSSGSLVDNNEMDMQHSRITTMANLVRLPISPGLRGYPKKKAMVGYHPFGNWEGSSRTPKLVIKALVIT